MIRRRATSQSGAPTGRLKPRPPVAPALTLREKLFWAAAILVVGGVLASLLWPVFSLLFASAALAYILSPLVHRLAARGYSRTGGALVLFGFGAVAVTLTALIVIPAVANQFSELSGNVQGYLNRASAAIGPAAAWVEARADVHIPLDLSALQEQLPGWITQLSPDARQSIQGWLSGLFTSGLGFLTGLLDVMLLPLFTFYLLRDWDQIMAWCRDLVPPRQRERAMRIAGEVDDRLSAFVQGQISLCLLLGVLYSVGLWVANIDLAFVVGMTAGILFIIPYFGPAVGLVLSLLLAFLKFGIDPHLLYVLGVFFGVQAAEGWVLTPVLVGDKVGLHPMVVMIALLVGGSLMGLWGMLLAIPATAILHVLLSEVVSLYRASAFYEGEG